MKQTFIKIFNNDPLHPQSILCLQVCAQSRPHFHRLLDSEHELFFLLSVILDRQSLAQNNASFAENLYSLRRISRRSCVIQTTPSELGVAKSANRSDHAASSTATNNLNSFAASLDRRQRFVSLVLVTLVPYLRAKLDSLYARHRDEETMAWRQRNMRGRGDGEIDNDAALPSAGREQSSTSTTAASSCRRRPSQSWIVYNIFAAKINIRSLLARLESYFENASAVVRKIFYQTYPYIYGAHEGARFMYQLLYMLGKSPYFSPELHLAGVTISRLTGQQAAQAQQNLSKRRAQRISAAERTDASAVIRFLRLGWIRFSNMISDHTKTSLIGAVFAFKLLEWWYTSAEQTLSTSKALPPPPPAPAIPPAKNGLPLPKDPSLCPLCKEKRTNPTIIATSGYVFCYPCAYKFVQYNGQCPVTRVPAQTRHLRRIYHGL